MKVLSRNF